MSFIEDRKVSDIGVMMAIDALIEMGYVIVPPDENGGIKGYNLDEDYHVDLSVYKVDDENIEGWKNRRPRPIAIDIKYVDNSPCFTGNMFFEVDNNEEVYGTRDGWGLAYYKEYSDPETRERIAREEEGIRNIMYIQRDKANDQVIMQAKTKEEFIERYKATRPNRSPFIIAPLHCMQWYYADNEDKTALDNHLSKLYRHKNGLLMPLSRVIWGCQPYKKKYPYVKGAWDEEIGKWKIEQLGKGKMARNRLADEGKLLEEDKAYKPLQQWQSDQKEQWEKGIIEYEKLASLF